MHGYAPRVSLSAPLLPRRDDEQRLRRGRDRVVLGLGVRAAGQRRVDDPRAAARRIAIGRDDVRHRSRPVSPENPDRDHRRPPHDADDPVRIVARRGERSGHVGAVTVGIGRIAVLLHEVPAADVVDLPVPVVVDPVALAPRATLARIAPDVAPQARMRGLDPGVDHGHPERVVTRLHAPGLPRVDVHIGRPGAAGDRLAAVHEPPQLTEQRVVRRRRRVAGDVGLGVEHVVLALQRLDRLAGRRAGLGIDDLGAGQRQPRLRLDIGPLADLSALAPVSVRSETHDHAVRRGPVVSGLGGLRGGRRGQQGGGEGRGEHPCS